MLKRVALLILTVMTLSARALSAGVEGCPAQPLALDQTANLALQIALGSAAGYAADNALAAGDYATYTAQLEALGEHAFLVALELALISQSLTPIYTNGPTYRCCLQQSPFWEPLFTQAAALLSGYQALYAKGLFVFGVDSASSLVKFYAFALTPKKMLAPVILYLRLDNACS